MLFSLHPKGVFISAELNYAATEGMAKGRSP